MPFLSPTQWIRLSILLLIAIGSFLGVNRVLGGESPHYSDAALHAVQFCDENEGWAVGDEGVIWHTIDGGKNWERQSSGVTASLRSICFLPGNAYVGWVAGRQELPGGGSCGVLLYTEDGGIKWQVAMLNQMPGLNAIVFADDKGKIGFAVGDGTESNPSGVWQAEDDWRKWKPIPGPRCPTWRAVGVTGQGQPILAGAWNRIATVRDQKLIMGDLDLLGGRSLRGLYLQGSRAIAVGQGGLLLTSDKPDQFDWRLPQPLLPQEIQTNCDFHAVHGHGQSIWVVGRPGSAVLHSDNGGKNWKVQLTGQSLPLNGIHFVDAKKGWAVGELGTILSTMDAGKSWKIQQRGGKQLAALCIHARAAGVPIETIAHLGARGGYLTGALRVTSPDPGLTRNVSPSSKSKDTSEKPDNSNGSNPNLSNPVRSTDEMRFVNGVRLAGGAAGEALWQFPLPSHLASGGPEELIKSWDTVLDDQSSEQLLQQMVLAFRIWQPSLVITDQPDERVTGYPVDRLIVEAVRTAAERAADPRVYPDQLHSLGLTPCKVIKVYGLCDAVKLAQVHVDMTEVVPALEGSVQELADKAAYLFDPRARAVSLRSFRHLTGMPGTEEHTKLMQGIDLVPGGEARRNLPETSLTNDQLRNIRSRLQLRAFSDNPSGLVKPEHLLANIGPMLVDIPDEQAGRILHSVAMQYSRIGQWALAREAFVLMIDRYPAHPLSVEAYRWLIRHNCSSEARRRHEQGQFLVKTTTTFGQVKSDVPVPKGQIPLIETLEEQEGGNLINPTESKQWYKNCVDLERKMAAQSPLAVRDPAAQFCLQSARRSLGDQDTPRRCFSYLAENLPEGPWRRNALAELWILDRKGPCPREMITCGLVPSRPKLDGKLDDACWKNATIVKLVDAAGRTSEDHATDIRMVRDQEYLYVGIRCFHPGGEKKPALKPRLHDQDLRDQDRVSLVLDLDRDYSTYFHLQMDQRGCILEDCWGDRSWNPRWFIAREAESCCWTVEIAIPLTALTADLVRPGQFWAFNAIRVLPGKGIQAFSLPAEAPEESLRTEGLGLLQFTGPNKDSQTPSRDSNPIPGN